MKKLLLTLTLALAACTPPHTIRAEALDPVLRRVVVRHQDYVDQDQTMDELERRIALRDGALLLLVLDEAASGDK